MNRGFPFCSACGAKLQGPFPRVCPACGVHHWVNAKPCAGVLVTDPDGRLLLLRRANEPWLGRWDIPGGFCDAEQHTRVTLNAYYHARAGAEVARPDDHETTELGWFAPDDLPPEIAFPNHAEAVLAAWREAVKEGRTVTPLPDR
jgi:ADP-ribose pyrophosphatase YjhB (NUDIX family)